MQTYPCYECGEKDKRIAELEAENTALVDGLRELQKYRFDNGTGTARASYFILAKELEALLGKESEDG